MPQSDRLLAWSEPRGDNQFIAVFVGGGAQMRRPAKRLFSAREHAQHWVEAEASTPVVPVEWLPGDRRRAPRHN